MGNYSDFFIEYVIVFSILIYAVLYIIINGYTINGEVKKPIILTIIIILTWYLFIMDDFNETIEDVNMNYKYINNIDESEPKLTYKPINKNLFKNDSIFIKQSDLKNNVFRLKY